jgi:HEAT repeat protein
MRNGGIDSVVAAGTRLNEYLASPDPEDRRFAADVLGEARVSNYYSPLLPLLADPDGAVRRAAVRAAGKLAHPRLLASIVPLLSDAELREAASAALIEFEEAALPELQKALRDRDQGGSSMRRIIRVVAHIGGPDAIGVLCDLLEHPDWSVQSSAYEALSLAGYRAHGEHSERIERSLLQEVKRAAWCWAAFEDLAASEHSGIVRDALRGDIHRCEDNLLLLLSCLHPAASVMAARRGLRSQSPDARAQALEILDNLVGSGIRSFVVALLEDFSPARRLGVLDKHFPQVRLGANERLGQLLDARSPVGLWTRLCVLYVIGQARLRSLEAELRPHLEDQLAVVRETAQWSRARL